MTKRLEQGRKIFDKLNPGAEAAFRETYDSFLPGFTETLIETAYGHFYDREGLDLKTRQLCTIAALTVLGGQTGPQLKINIKHTLAAGASRTEILEAIFQMAVYGGMPAAINGIHAAREVFDAEDAAAA